MTASGDGDQADGDQQRDGGVGGGGGASATGPIRARGRKRESPPETPKSGPDEAHVPTATPTHAQNLVFDERVPVVIPQENLPPLPVPSDDEIDAWFEAVGEKLENLRHEIACREYLTDYSPKKAMVRAGFSKEYADNFGVQFFRRPVIAARVKQLQDAMARNVGISVERVAQEIASIGFSRVSDIIEISPGGKLRIKDLTTLRDDQLAAIDEIKCDPETGEIVCVKMHPKMPALEMLGKHLRMWDKDDNRKRGTTFNLNVTIGSDGAPGAPIIEGTAEDVDDEQRG